MIEQKQLTTFRFLTELKNILSNINEANQKTIFSKIDDDDNLNCLGNIITESKMNEVNKKKQMAENHKINSHLNIFKN